MGFAKRSKGFHSNKKVEKHGATALTAMERVIVCITEAYVKAPEYAAVVLNCDLLCSYKIVCDYVDVHADSFLNCTMYNTPLNIQLTSCWFACTCP